jgi:autotransporter-associated beta strand protein
MKSSEYRPARHLRTETIGKPFRFGIACACLALASLAFPARGTPVELLANSGFEAPFSAVNNTNSYGIVSGSFPSKWADNSRYSGKHTVNVYTQEVSDTVSGSAFRVAASVQSGYGSGANVEMYQNFYAVAQRPYTARVWLKCSSPATVTLGIRMTVSPFTQRAATNCQASAAWTCFALNFTAVANELLAFEVKHGAPSLTLWVDEASCAVQDGHRSWFVSPDGSDSSAGSLAAPFQTLARAVTNLNAGDTLYLRGGTYRETLRLPQSGTPENPITVCAYSNENVTLSGCDVLAGPWSPASNGIYAASTEWTLGSGYNQVFADNAMQHEARHPDHGSSDLLSPATAPLSVSSNYTVTCSAFDGKGDLTGARFYASVGSSWSWQTAATVSNRTGALFLNPSTASTWWWPNYANKSSDTGRGFLYGLPALLDADGEWFLQTNAAAPHTLSVRLPGGADPSGHLVELKRRAWCVDISSQNFIIVSNLAFRAGAVRLSGEGLVLDSCDARHLSHYLTFSSGGSANGGRPEGGGIVVSGTSNTVRRCTVADTAGSGILASGTGHLITRNHVFNTDYSATYATGMTLSGTGIRATFNTLHDTGRDLLQPTGKGLSILYNDFFRAGRLCKDLGAVYAWGTNGKAPDGTITRIAFNWVHDSTENDPLGMGIYIDNYSHNFQIDHNVVWNFGVLGTQTWSDGLRLNSPAEALRLYHNTLFRCRNYNYSTYTPYRPGSNTPENVYWTTNNHHLFYIAQNNLYMTNAATELENAGARDFRLKAASASVDPAFVTNVIAWTTTNGVLNVPPNFKLSMTDKNQSFSFEEQGGLGVPVDTDNDQTPDAFVGTSPDSGAYERGGAYWVPGINGWPVDWPGVRSETPFDYVGTVVTAKGTLLSSGNAPASVFLHWGPGSNPAAWTNAVCLGTAFAGTYQPILFNLAGIQLYTAYGYRFQATNTFGETWSEPLTFTTGSGIPINLVWDGGGGTNLAVDATNNWETETQQDFNGATHAFFGSGGSTAVVNRAISLYGLTFNRAANFTLASGGGSVALRGGGLSASVPSATSRTYALAADLTLADQQTWSVTNNGAGVTSLDVAGAVSDASFACGLTKTGDGTLTLKAANTYRGVTTVSNGLVAITHAAALGSAEGGTVVRSTQGGRLQLSGGIVVPEPLTLNGERAASGYSLISSGGSNVWSGPLTRIGQTRINTASGSALVMAGGATGGGGLYVANTYGTLVIAEKPLLIGNDTFWADSTGTTVLSVAGNIWGDTILGNGTLRTDVAYALPSNTKLKIGLSYAPSCTLNLNGFDQTVGQLLNNTTTAGVRTITSPALATLTVNQAINTNFDGRFTGAVRLLKTGTGALTLSGTNSTSSGGMTVSNGTLSATAAASLGLGPVTLLGGTLRNAVPPPAALQMTNLTWHASGALALTLLPDGSSGRAAISDALSRGAGSTFFFDFSNSGAPNRTYTLLTFGSTTFAETDFRCRNLGSIPSAAMRGAFTLTGNALTLRTFIPTATVLTVR